MRAQIRAVRNAAIGWRRSAQRRIHRLGMASLDKRQRGIVEALERDGATVASLDQLAIPGTTQMLSEARRAIEGLEVAARGVAAKSYLRGAPHAVLQGLPELFVWGLSEWLLGGVEYYLGKPAFYRGVVCRRDLPDGQAVETRLFHRDAEDVRSLKVIVYLNDVSEAHGPYEYVPKPFTPRMDDLAFREGRVPDEEMRRHVDEFRWIRCTGPAGTVVIADTCSIFHRGRVPTAGHRDALFFAFNSRRPTSPDMAGPIFDFAPLLPGLALSDRQRAALRLEVDAGPPPA